MYSKYFLQEGKRSKRMAKKITSLDELKLIASKIKEYHILGIISENGWMTIRVGERENSLKANIGKELGFRYVGYSMIWEDDEKLHNVSKLAL